MYRNREGSAQPPPPPPPLSPTAPQMSIIDKSIYPVYVANIDIRVQIADLRRVFGRCGPILEVTIISDHGFINFANPEDARRAILTMNGFELFGRLLHVDYSDEFARYLHEKGGEVVQFTPNPEEEQFKDRSLPKPVWKRRRSRTPPPRGRTRMRSRTRSPPPRPPPPPPPLPSSRIRRREEIRHRRHPSPIPPKSPHKPKIRSRSRSRSRSRNRARSRDRDRDSSNRRRRRRSRSKNLEPLKTDVEKVDDLREMLRNRHHHQQQQGSPQPPPPPSTPPQITKEDNNAGSEIEKLQIEIQADNKKSTNEPNERKVSVQKQSESSNEKTVQKLYLGNLFNPVEKEDIERLFEMVGPVVSIELNGTNALVTLECSREDAEEAIETLDKNTWMDNRIRVQFHGRRRKPRWDQHDDRTEGRSKYSRKESKKESPEERRPSRHQKEKEVATTTTTTTSTAAAAAAAAEDVKDATSNNVDPKLIDDFLKSQRESETPVKPNKVKKLRHFSVYSSTMHNKNFLEDMREVFSKFGTVQRCTKDDRTILIEMVCTDRQAVNCILETNDIKYKGQELRVKFAEGSYEDSPEFLSKYSIELRRYHRQLIPDHELKGPKPRSNKVPIGVLPPSSSLGAFGSNVPLPKPNIDSFLQRHIPPVQQQQQPQQQQQQLSQYCSDVQGRIHSINNKIILIQFYSNGTSNFAKLIPGQMYVNGRTSLGFIIKNNTFHTWPAVIRDFLHQGGVINMNVKRMNEREIAEISELCSEAVYYSTPLVWKNIKPTEKDVTIKAQTANFTILKGVVTKLFPKWGILTHVFYGDIFFRVQHLYIENGALNNSQSLLKHLEMGDILAVHCIPAANYDEVSEEIATSAVGYHGLPLYNVKFMARLVWHISAEVDPYAHKGPEDDESTSKCDFLTTSSTLNCQLPFEKDALHKSLSGTIEEIHLPAGGIIALDDCDSPKEAEKKVYFHRSRLYINGAKIQSNVSLDRELVPGDKVRVDVIPNRAVESSVAYVLSGAYWVALSVQLRTTGRGINFAKSLRMEDHDLKYGPNVAKGRVVYLHPPEAFGEHVNSGIAVIDTGDFAGQRVEFERVQCHAFGHSLKSVDLSLIFHFGDEVFIKVKPYNSYCVEKLWIGFEEIGGDSLSQYDRQLMKKYFYDHGLDSQSFEAMVRGHSARLERPFIPLRGQPLKGKIKSLQHESSGGPADKMVIEASEMGEILYVEAPRSKIYIYGRCLAKADLSYLFENEEVWFELHPIYDKKDPCQGESSSGVMEMPKASLIWYGEESSRPHYMGPSSQPEISPRMDCLLLQFLRCKKMDEKMFQSLIEGKLMPKAEVKPQEQTKTNKASSSEDIDEETLKQAALLKQMKETFGPTACLQAMMLLMSGGGSESKPSTSKDDMGSVLEMAKQIMKMKDEQKNQPEQCLIGPQLREFYQEPSTSGTQQEHKE